MTNTETADTRCVLCGWVIEDLDLSEETNQGVVHFDRQCPKGSEPKKPASKRQPKAPKMGDPIVVKEMRIVGVRGAHAECDHPATKSARAACRKARNAGK